MFFNFHCHWSRSTEYWTTFLVFSVFMYYCFFFLKKNYVVDKVVDTRNEENNSPDPSGPAECWLSAGHWAGRAAWANGPTANLPNGPNPKK